MCNSCAGINLLIKINKTSPASVAARQGGFIDPVRCVQTSLVKPAPTRQGGFIDPVRCVQTSLVKPAPTRQGGFIDPVRCVQTSLVKPAPTRQGGFIDPVRCVQTSLVKPAPTQSKTLALPLLKDMILLIIKALFLQWVRNPVF